MKFGTKEEPDEVEGGVDTVFLRRAMSIFILLFELRAM